MELRVADSTVVILNPQTTLLYFPRIPLAKFSSFLGHT